MRFWNPTVGPLWEIRVQFDADDNAWMASSLESLCEGVVRYNIGFLERHPEIPCCLGNAGVRYIAPPGCNSGARGGPCQTLLSTPEILRRRVATCIDIANHLTACLRMRGVPASTVAENMLEHGANMPIPGMYHILTLTPEGIIDPTQELIDGRVETCSIFDSLPVLHPSQYAGEIPLQNR